MLTKVKQLFADVQGIRAISHGCPRFAELPRLSQFGIARNLVEDFQTVSGLRLDIKTVFDILHSCNPAILNGRICPTELVTVQQSLTSWWMVNMASALAQTASNRVINI